MKDKNGKRLFNAPNNEEGRMFCKLLTKFRNPQRVKRFRWRGRGPNRPIRTFAGDLAIGNAEWFAVYADKVRV